MLLAQKSLLIMIRMLNFKLINMEKRNNASQNMISSQFHVARLVNVPIKSGQQS